MSDSLSSKPEAADGDAAAIWSAAEAEPLRETVAAQLAWLRQAAWPRWLSDGLDPSRGFHEHLRLEDHRCGAEFRRLRVLTRQIYVFAEAHRDSPPLPGAAEAVGYGVRVLREHGVHPEGGYHWRFDLDHRVTDDRRELYDLAFALLALSSATAVLPAAELRAEARALLGFIRGTLRHREGGYHEGLPPALPRRQNPHMHLFEAVLAAHDAFADPEFGETADEVAALFADRLIDPATGALPEYFDETLAVQREHGRFLVEPGHHCEWVWLLHRYRERRGGAAVLPTDLEARMLHLVDAAAVDRATGGIVDELWSDGTVRAGSQRLWPQTERLKAELLRADPDPHRAARAAAALSAYLRPDGLWSERRDAAGVFSAEAAPASSLYHLTCAILTAADRLGLRCAAANPARLA